VPEVPEVPEQELAKLLRSLFDDRGILELAEEVLGEAAAAELREHYAEREIATAAARWATEHGRVRALLAGVDRARPHAYHATFRHRCLYFRGWETSPSVFLVFDDVEEAALVTERLERAGLTVGLASNELLHSEDMSRYATEAATGIRRSKCLLTLVSESTQGFPNWWLWPELRAARERGQATLIGVIGRVADEDLPRDAADVVLDLRALSKRPRRGYTSEQDAALDTLTEAVQRATSERAPPRERLARPSSRAAPPGPQDPWWRRPASPRVIRGLGLVLVLAGLGLPWAVWGAGWLDAPTRRPTPPEPQPKPKHEKIAEATNLRPALIRVPAGTFTMGSPDGEGDDDEHPAHQVTLPSFLVCDTEVTQAQYRAVVDASPSDCGEGGKGCGDDYPVNSVSWNDACAYMNGLTVKENARRGGDEPALTPCYVEEGDSWTWPDKACTGYRLPTEEEWEYAARAGTQGAYSFKDGEAEPANYAWFGLDYSERARPVRKKALNPWELADVHGNVWEWCWDWFDAEWYATKKSQREVSFGPDNGSVRVLRGGGFYSTARNLRSAHRVRDSPSVRRRLRGFRCVRSWPSSVDP